jgi:hypothetical protein
VFEAVALRSLLSVMSKNLRTFNAPSAVGGTPALLVWHAMIAPQFDKALRSSY